MAVERDGRWQPAAVGRLWPCCAATERGHVQPMSSSSHKGGEAPSGGLGCWPWACGRIAGPGGSPGAARQPLASAPRCQSGPEAPPGGIRGTRNRLEIKNVN